MGCCILVLQLNQLGGLMTKLSIDVGANACIAKCGHCRLGAEQLPTVAVLSPDTVRVTEQVLAYAKAHGQKTRLAFVSPLLSMSEMLFLRDVDELSVSFVSLAELQAEQEEVLKRLAGFTGEVLQLQLNSLVLHEYLVPQCMDVAKRLFVEIATLLPQVRHVYLGINHNTVTLPAAVLQQESVVAGFAFTRYLERSLEARRDFGLSEVRLENSGPSMRLRATVGVGQRHFSLVIRYIIKPEEAWQYLSSPFDSPHIKELALLVVDRGVNVAHHASAINQTELWFTHAEFEELLERAATEDMPLFEVCKKAVRQRRK